MASAAQRAYQPQEERTSQVRSDWNQLMNSSLGRLDDEEEQRSGPTGRPLRPVRPVNTSNLRAMPAPTTAAQPRPHSATGQGIMTRLSGASNALGQAKPVIYIALGAVALVAAYLLVSTAAAFVGTKLDDMTYTTTRTTNLDAYVGHNETPGNPTHFTAQNIRGQIAIIEYPGGDPSKALTIIGPYLFGQGEDKVPVSLSIADINGDGKPDLLITAKGAQTAYINDGNSFRAIKPEERAAIEKARTSAASASASSK
jgi:FG-GAP repeat